MHNRSLIRRGKYVNREVLVVGIDIGKYTHAAVGTSLENGFTKPYYIKNKRKSYEDFESIMKDWRERFNCKYIVIGFESTGHYWKPIGYYLKDRGYILCEVSPSNTKKSKEMMDNSPLKSDPKDARVIADLVKQGKVLTPVFPEGKILSLREIVHTRENIIKERTSILNRLEKIIDVTFPERKQIIKKVGNKTSLFLLKRTPFPEDIQKKSLRWLSKHMCKESRGRYNGLKAQRLYNLAKETIGLKQNMKGFLYELNTLLVRLKEINKKINEVESVTEKYLEDIEESRYLLSIKGVGPNIAAAVISESGGLNKYNRAESVIKIAGLNLYERSSGKSKGEKHITKRGRKLMRQKLYFAALQQTHPGMPFYSYYRRLVEENGVEKTKAIIATARKLLRIMFALVRDKSEYDGKHKEIELKKEAA